jgi:hypothetical protein
MKIKTVEQLNAILEELDLCDIWRIRNPLNKRYTWSGSAQGLASKRKQKLYRRLDFFFISDHLQSSVRKSDIIPAPATDHSAISIVFDSLPQNKHGPSMWKFNNSLLKDKDYIRTISELVQNTKKDFQGADPHFRWEFLKYEIRKVTISFSKTKAKKNRELYRDLESKLITIENINDWESDNRLIKEHEEIKYKLNERSDKITEGLILRSKTNWIEYGEKSSKFFLNLEKQRKSKTHVRKIINSNAEEITNPKEILKEIENFYGNIFSRKNTRTEEECIKYIGQLNTPKLTNEERQKCEGPLKLQECYESLTKMGNDKTPGNDGLTKEFYIAFWNILGKDMVNSLNYSFEKGFLSTTQRQVTVTLLEKPNKDVGC